MILADNAPLNGVKYDYKILKSGGILLKRQSLQTICTNIKQKIHKNTLKSRDIWLKRKLYNNCTNIKQQIIPKSEDSP
jgi:hypothetical protein